MVHVLAETLHSLGQEVTLLAGKGSKFSGRLVEFGNQWGVESETRQFKWIMENIKDCDIVHENTPYRIFLNNGPKSFPYCWTNHGDPYDKFIVNGRRNMVVQSKAEAKYYEEKFGQKNIPVIPPSFFLKTDSVADMVRDYQVKIDGEVWTDYLLFIGNVSYYKGVNDCIEIAEKTGERLIIAGPVKDNDEYKSSIAPHLNAKIRHIGEVPYKGEQKCGLIRNAKCLCYLSRVRDSIGIAQQEGMMAGTPIIVYDMGGIIETVEGAGKYAHICKDVDDCCEYVKWLNENPPTKDDRQFLQDHVIRKSGPEKTAKAYINLYEEIIKGRNW